MSSKKKNNNKDKEKDLKQVENNEEPSEIIQEDDNDSKDIEENDGSENTEENDNSENIEENDNDSDEDTEEQIEEEKSLSEEDSDKNLEEENKEISEEKEEINEGSKDKQENNKKKKKEKQEEDSDEPDYFWVKVLVVTIIIVWGALIAGSWAGNYFLKSDFFKRHNSQVVDDNKPKVWKTIVEVDKSGAVSKSAVLADNTDDLQIDDFRNTNEPIPGIDDQSLKSLKDIEPLQEPSDDSSSVEVQIASEETMENANKIAEELKAKGYNPTVEPFTENGANKYRVKISETSTDNANKKIEELKALDYKPFIIGK